MTRDELLPIMVAMQKFGGGFASKLASAMFHADGNNLQRIVNAFPDLIDSYKKFADLQVVKDELSIERLKN
jgi:hypothetical protein